MMGTIAPPAARALARLHEAGFEAWLVGGCVRDMLLGCAPKDYDLATSARPEETKAVFQGETVLETGIRHGTVTVLLEGMPLEITTYRVDGAYSDARHPDGVTFADNLRADAARRDFTINAMAYAPGQGLRDYFGGQADLRAGCLRAVGDPGTRFQEDALRILRGLRFAAVLAHRNAHHCYDVWTHTAVAVDHVPPRLPLRLAMLLHDMGKPDTFSLGEDGQGHFYGHPRRSVELAEGILTRLRFPRRTREQVLCLVRYHDAVIEESPQRVRRWLNKLGPERFFDLLEIQRGDASAQAPAYCTRLDHLRRLEKIAGEVLAEAPCLTVRELAVGGRELLALGYQGPAIGMALRRLLDCVLEGTLPNEKTALLQYLEQIDAKKSEGKRNKSSGET